MQMLLLQMLLLVLLLVLLLFQKKLQQTLNKLNILFMRTQLQHWEVHKETINMLILHCQIMRTLEVDVVAQVSSRVSAQLHRKLLSQNFINFLHVQFRIQWMVQSLVATNLLFRRLIPQIVSNPEILVVVATSLQLVDLVGTHTEMDVQNFLLFVSIHYWLQLVDIAVNVFGGNFNDGTLKSRDVCLSEMFSNKLGRVDLMVAKNFKSREINLIKHEEYNLLLILQIVQPMLKFKGIKNSIISSKPKCHQQELQSSVNPSNIHSPLTFKTITQHTQLSPLYQLSAQKNNGARFETDKKATVSPFHQQNFRSDGKQNSIRNIYYPKSPTTFSDLSFKKLQFGGQTKRKTTHKEPNLYTDTFTENHNEKNNLSFANLLSSKKPTSKGKFYMQSERNNNRQSSISKLKDKLFGMKRIISEKEQHTTPIRTHDQKINKNHQGINLSPYQLDAYPEDIVKISIKGQSPPHQLDMTPYLS